MIDDQDKCLRKKLFIDHTRDKKFFMFNSPIRNNRNPSYETPIKSL